MKVNRLISKPTIAIVKDALAEMCTHTEMQSLFEEYSFEQDPTRTFSNKVQRASCHLDHQDWDSPEVVRQLLGMLEQRFAQLASRFRDGLASSEPCQRIIETMRDREGYNWDGQRFCPRSAIALSYVAQKAGEFGIDSLQAEIDRVLASVDSDPADAITAAKSLVEATCRAILSESGNDPPKGIELGSLTKQTVKNLQLLPEQIDDASKGAEAARKVLHSTATAVQGLGELRNLYGDAHGKGPGSKGLEPRHARMAATFAGGLAMFLLETHQQRAASRSG